MRDGAVTRRSDGKPGSIKCVVWDLDGTLWDGILLEDDAVTPRPGVVEVLRTLDRRGVLHSIASRNDPAAAMAKLESLGIADLFLYPQIGWGAKSASVAAVAKALNIGLDAIAFVDDQGFEREEVGFALPAVTCVDAGAVPDLPAWPELTPPFVTQDSARRRAMYLSDQRRGLAEQEFSGPGEEFLATLGMVFSVAPAGEDDLARAEELTVRTNQLNTTGRPYSYEELDALRVSPGHSLLIAGLEDRFGTYGKIGLSLVDRDDGVWTIRLLLMSCRVMSRGVGTTLLNEIQRGARDAGVRLQAEFVENDRNRMMYMTYRFAGFREVHRDGSRSILEAALDSVSEPPPYVDLRVTPWVR
jgi:FkbH-like protein